VPPVGFVPGEGKALGLQKINLVKNSNALFLGFLIALELETLDAFFELALVFGASKRIGHRGQFRLEWNEPSLVGRPFLTGHNAPQSRLDPSSVRLCFFFGRSTEAST
jgi:hypothetical protein